MLEFINFWTKEAKIETCYEIKMCSTCRDDENEVSDDFVQAILAKRQ